MEGYICAIDKIKNMLSEAERLGMKAELQGREGVNGIKAITVDGFNPIYFEARYW
jgi:hypothetical protein